MFPRQNSKKYSIVICGTSGLKSAIRDGHSLSTVMSERGFETILAIDSESSNSIRTIEGVTKEIERIKKIGGDIDLFISISAHGYTSGRGSNYFYFGGKKVGRQIMRPWFNGLKYPNAQVLVLIDTCHSENMVGFQRREPIPSTATNGSGSSGGGGIHGLALAGCRQHQSLSEDTSDRFGYGGGLTSAFLDALGDSKEVTFEMLKQCQLRLKSFGVVAVITQIDDDCAQIKEDFDLSDFIKVSSQPEIHEQSIGLLVVLIVSVVIYGFVLNKLICFW
jgi:hypothetical protein